MVWETTSADTEAELKELALEGWEPYSAVVIKNNSEQNKDNIYFHVADHPDDLPDGEHHIRYYLKRPTRGAVKPPATRIPGPGVKR